MANNKKTVDDITVGIRLVVDPQSERKAKDNLSTFRRSVMRGMAALGGGLSVKKILDVSKNIIEAKHNADLLSKSLGMSAGEIYRLDRASSRFGTSFSDQLLNIQSLFAGLGMEDIGALIGDLSKFGIDTGPLLANAQNPKALMNEIMAQWQGLNKEQRVKTGETLGFDQNFINLLNSMGRFESILNRIKEPSKAEIEEAKAAQESMKNLGLKVDQLWNSIAVGLTPAINILTGALGEIKGEEIAESINTLVAFISKYMGMNDTQSINEKETKELLQLEKSIDASLSNPLRTDEQKKKLTKEKQAVRQAIFDQEFAEMKANLDKRVELDRTAEKLSSPENRALIRSMLEKTMNQSSSINDPFIQSVSGNARQVHIENINNTYEIQGADAEEVVKLIEERDKEHLQNVLAEGH